MINTSFEFQIIRKSSIVRKFVAIFVSFFCNLKHDNLSLNERELSWQLTFIYHPINGCKLKKKIYYKFDMSLLNYTNPLFNRFFLRKYDKVARKFYDEKCYSLVTK